MATQSEKERLAVVETELKHVSDKLEKLGDSMDNIQEQLNVLNGRWGIILMVISGISFLAVFFKDFILTKLGMR